MYFFNELNSVLQFSEHKEVIKKYACILCITHNTKSKI